MNLEQLRSVQSKERQTDSLQHLRESFYEDVSAYVSELEARREQAAAEAEDPFADPEVRRLTDEIETAREVVEAIYERRLGKLVKRASLAAANMPADEDGLTAEERVLFDDLVERIRENKEHVLDVLDADADVEIDPAEAGGSAGTTEEDGPETDAASTGANRLGDEAAAVADPEAKPPEAGGEDGDAGTDPKHGRTPASGADGDGDGNGDAGGQPDGGAAQPDAPGLGGRTTVRITGDVEEFYGVDDREYDLDREDVVTLPEANAEPLLDAGDAERVE